MFHCTVFMLFSCLECVVCQSYVSNKSVVRTVNSLVIIIRRL